VWTYAFCEQENRYAILLNNRLKEGYKKDKIGLLTSKHDQGQENYAVRVPILEKIKLRSPF